MSNTSQKNNHQKLRQVVFDSSNFKQFGYFSIPHCCDLLKIKPLQVKNRIPKNGLTEMIFFKWVDKSIAENLCSNLASKIKQYFLGKGYPTNPPIDVKYFWIHVSTSCRVEGIHASDKKEKQNYDCNYFKSKKDAQFVIDHIIKSTFKSYGILL